MKVLKKAYPMIIAAFCVYLFISLRFFLMSVGIITGSIQGFALDSKEKLYVGVGKQINVYSSGKLINVIYPSVSHTFRFYMKNDTLVIGSSDRRATKIYDLNGNVISDCDVSYEEVQAVAKSNKTIEINGNIYSYSAYLGFKPAEILRNGDVVYKMSFLDYFFSGPPYAFILIVLGTSLAFSIMFFVTDEEVKAFLKSL